MAPERFRRHFLMWFPKPQHLSAAPADMQFICLRWHELFDAYTPDSFQPRICQLPTLVDEIAVAAQDGLRNPRFNHLPPIQAELAKKLSGEVESALCSNEEKFHLRRIANAQTPAEAYSTVEHLQQSDFRQSFENALTARGNSAILRALNGTPASKEGADAWLSAWATLALDRQYLDRDDRIDFDDGLLNGNADGILGKIVNTLNGQKRRYQCVLEIALTPEIARLDLTSKERVLQMLAQVLEKTAGNLVSRTLLPGDPMNRILVHREIEAVGAQAALSQFAGSIQPALNLFDLYRNAPTTVRLREGWVGDSISNLTRSKIRDRTLQKLHPRKQAANLTVNALSERETAGSVDATIANALELYHVAMATEDRRVRFLTLWSAMECLSQSIDGESTLERVGGLVVPVVIWRRMEKQLRYLAINIKFLRDALPSLKSETAEALPNATEKEVQIEDILETVTRKHGDPRLDSLGKHCTSHSLLVWRARGLWKIFHKPADLRNDLMAASERLDWQLARIYRARNRLIHGGEESRLLPHLSNNLQYYFSTAISRLLHGIGQKKDKSSRHAAYRWKSQWEFVLDRLSNEPSCLRMEHLLPTPNRGETIPLWPKA
jgi:hypothetical protein